MDNPETKATQIIKTIKMKSKPDVLLSFNTNRANMTARVLYCLSSESISLRQKLGFSSGMHCFPGM